MNDPARKLALYDQLMMLPENLTGEILNGQLHTQPRPTGPHAFTQSNIESDLNNPFSRGRGNGIRLKTKC